MIFFNIIWLVAFTHCASSAYKPCALGVVDMRQEEDVFEKMTIKRCEQKEFENGTILNHGSFRAFDADEKLRVSGFYEKGLKHGRWDFYKNGKIEFSRFYEHGLLKKIE